MIQGTSFTIVGIDLPYKVISPDSQGRTTCCISSSKIFALSVVAILKFILSPLRSKPSLIIILNLNKSGKLVV
jgi:hypothetical protein